MAKDALLQVRLDPQLKQDAEQLYASMGMTLSEAVRVFLTKSLRVRKLPSRPSRRPRKASLRLTARSISSPAPRSGNGSAKFGFCR